VRKGYRKKGVSSALIAASLDAVKRAGAPALEAYPLDGALTKSASHTGYASTFLRAGFEVVARHAPLRPIMRHYLQSVKLCAPGIDFPNQAGQISENINYRWKDKNGNSMLSIISEIS
jgi:hypothetical protein